MVRPARNQKKGRKRWLLAGALLGLAVIAFFFFPQKTIPPPSKPAIPPEPSFHIQEGNIEKNSSLYQSLMELKIPVPWVHLIISKLEPHVDFRRIRGGTFRILTDDEGELVKFVYEKSPIEVYKVEKGEHGYVAQQKDIPLDRYLVKVEGEITSSLFEAMNAAGEEDALTIAFADILAWEIDFYQDLRKGDRFNVVVEKIYREDRFVQYGTIHAVEFRQGDKTIRGIRYRDDYYQETGNSLKRAFLKAPLKFDRVSSRFSHARRHPILGGVRPHHGVDYAAPSGTPIWAVADGVVNSVGWAGGFGKQVVLQHRNGYKTYYGHLSRYGPGIKNGARVRQKQVIGYVGATGLATGPHLDYRINKHGRFRNPLKESFATGEPVAKKDWIAFEKRRDEVMAWLSEDSPFRKRLDPMTGEVTENHPTDSTRSTKNLRPLQH
jgi:murein DD-endopeptidase MepM/ murein hydrolase activator NlpD